MFSNIDRIGEDGQKICAFFAVTSGAGFAVKVVKISEEGETVSLLEVSNYCMSLLVSIDMETVVGGGVGDKLLVPDVTRRLLVLVSHHMDLNLMIFSLPRKDRVGTNLSCFAITSLVLKSWIINTSSCCLLRGGVVVGVETHPLGLVIVSHCGGGIQQTPDL